MLLLFLLLAKVVVTHMYVHSVHSVPNISRYFNVLWFRVCLQSPFLQSNWLSSECQKKICRCINKFLFCFHCFIPHVQKYIALFLTCRNIFHDFNLPNIFQCCVYRLLVVRLALYPCFCQIISKIITKNSFKFVNRHYISVQVMS